MMRISVTIYFGLALPVSLMGLSMADPLLYPFGKAEKDEELPAEVDGSSSKLIASPDKYQILQTRDRRVYVNANGLVSLHAPFAQSNSSPLPISPDVFLALFWANHYVKPDVGETVWYRLSDEKSDVRRVKNDVRNNFKECNDNFKPDVVLVATWECVHSFEFFNGKRETHSTRQRRTLQPSNTYQAVMATDGDDTYAILNYFEIKWISSDGNRALVGFNAGDGEQFYEHPLSGTKGLADLATGSNVGVPGRWMYKISGARVVGPDCTEL